MTRELNRNATSGYRAIMGEIRTNDLGDPFNTAMGWVFDLSDVAFVEFDECLPGFMPSPFLQSRENVSVYPGHMIFDLIDDGLVTEQDIRDAHAVMVRYAKWAKLAGYGE